jgi:hypothetical protein
VPAATEARATGTAIGVPRPSVFAPSSGTTGPVLFAGVGLLLGIPEIAAFGRLRAAGLPPAVAASAPAVTPITTSTLTTTRSTRLGAEAFPGPPPMIHRRSRRLVSVSERIPSTIRPDGPGRLAPDLALAR